MDFLSVIREVEDLLWLKEKQILRPRE